MASIPVLFLLSVMLLPYEVTSGKKHRGNIALESELSPGSTWRSNSGLFAFSFYPHGDGYAVGILLVGQPTDIIIWTANRHRPQVPFNYTLELNALGLLLRSGEGDTETEAESENLIPVVKVRTPVDSASMEDSGNFVLYDTDSDVIWQSFDFPTDTILGGQNLTSFDKLVSAVSESDHSSGHFYLQYDGSYNLVASPSSSLSNSYWSTNFSDAADTGLGLTVEGFLSLDNNYLFNSTNLRKKSQNTTSIYRATLDFDGNFRLYEHQFVGNTSSGVLKLWSALPDECQIKGFCGFNSYCLNKSGNAVCECFPGFVPSKSSGNNTMFLDCDHNHSKAFDCESSEDPKTVYNVTSLKDISWSDIPYSVIPMEMEACSRSCREDCYCGAALYSSGNCRKHKLPIRYSRRIDGTTDSGVGLFRVPSGNVISPNHTVQPLSQMKPKIVVDNDHKKSQIIILASILGSILLFCLVIVVSIIFNYKRQVHRYTTLSASANLGLNEEVSLRSFSFDELAKSTGGFTEEIGRGSFGAVYKGTMGDSNTGIAVKRLERIVDEGEREFRAEITAVARTHHRNLVKLIGLCIDGSRKLLVYEHVSNGSLANLLFKAKMRLSWRDRIKIALDVARGILYLHDECEVRIIHCNIKPQNILMDEAWTAKISDFGLARLLKPEYSRTKPGEEGKSGYLAPEWQKEAPVSVKADIYSFGVVLLEIVCRRSNIDLKVSSAEEILLSSWVHQCFAAGQLNKLVKDDEAGDEVDWMLLERMVKVGLWCVQDDPPKRPTMKNIILMLEGFKDIPIPPSPAHLSN